MFSTLAKLRIKRHDKSNKRNSLKFYWFGL